MRVHGKTYIWLVLKLNAIENTKAFTLFDNGVFFCFFMYWKRGQLYFSQPMACNLRPYCFYINPIKVIVTIHNANIKL